MLACSEYPGEIAVMCVFNMFVHIKVGAMNVL
jgi:hypothetical protein